MIYKHSKFVEQQIGRHVVARIDNRKWDLIREKLESELEGGWDGYQKKELLLQKEEDEQSKSWKIVERNEILPGIMLILFESEYYNVLNYLPGVE